ncbi:hypothetical protein BY458DRAFT_532308 [Sporodiniella umbellata]|nr:hypothetical protein BY458DRAFT_532308 [Sporodiniella umbellata]
MSGFKFNFTNQDLDLEDTEESQPLESSLQDLNINEEKTISKLASKEYDIRSSRLPEVIQADRLEIHCIDTPIYKRTLADVRFEIAQQDNFMDKGAEEIAVMNMLSANGNSDLVKGVYEGGFKTWECSIDMVEYLSSLPKEQTNHKKILELGCGSSIPSLYLLSEEKANQVDIQDYNEQVIRYVSIPNILLNTVLNVQEPVVAVEPEQAEESSSDESEDDDDDDDDDDAKRIEEDPVTCDAEAEISSEQVPMMLEKVSARTRAFYGDWSTLPEQLGNDQGQYDMIVTSETIYAEHSFVDLVRVFQKALKKPEGVW